MVIKHWKKQKKTKKISKWNSNEKWGYKSKEQKSAITLNKLRKKKCLMIFQKLHLNINQIMEKHKKYYLLNKWSKDYLIPAQVKPANISKHLLNKVRQSMYFFYWAREITKKALSKKKRYNGKVKLHSWILQIVKYLTLIDCYSIFQIK